MGRQGGVYWVLMFNSMLVLQGRQRGVSHYANLWWLLYIIIVSMACQLPVYKNSVFKFTSFVLMQKLHDRSSALSRSSLSEKEKKKWMNVFTCQMKKVAQMVKVA